jgi:N-acetylated-alpha-linked acidic dipeptidase
MTIAAMILVVAFGSVEPPSSQRTAAALLPDPARLAAYHELFAREPHVAGTEGDARAIERLRAAFVEMGDGVKGWSVEVQEFFPLLAHPVRASLEVVESGGAGVDRGAPAADGASPRVLSLPLREPPIATDPDTAHPALDIAWNAWSGSGTVEAGVVYVHFGRREDFERLAALGIDPRGKIALARYGGNFRGYKAKFAEAAGCVGLVMFTDPADSGSVRGRVWPEGGWANDDYVQRGSVLVQPAVGDPTTPGRASTRDAERVPTESLSLPTIPVQPIGAGAAREIVSRMKGVRAPDDWQGGLGGAYSLEDAGLRLRLSVEQTHEVRRTANVFARLEGAAVPEEIVIVGSHHDAWSMGAADPLAGTICMLECARNFAALARAGSRPDRTLVFAAWGAEEYGIFGSTEFVEKDAERLAERAVAYINLDMSAMGLKPGGAVSPTLRPSVERALAAAPGPAAWTARTPADGDAALDAWPKAADGRPQFGNLGGGSDHVAFWCHAGIPSIALSAGGSEGVSYHSNYDTLAWYRAAVGADYASAQLVTGMANAIVAELADSGSTHISPVALIDDGLAHAAELRKLARERGLGETGELADTLIDTMEWTFRRMRIFAVRAEKRIAESPRASDAADLWSLRRIWLSESGLVGRPWYRNLIAAPDRDAGYATSSWPLLREAILDAKPDDPASREAILIAADAYLEAQSATYGLIARLIDDDR